MGNVIKPYFDYITWNDSNEKRIISLINALFFQSRKSIGTLFFFQQIIGTVFLKKHIFIQVSGN